MREVGQAKIKSQQEDNWNQVEPGQSLSSGDNYLEKGVRRVESML